MASPLVFKVYSCFQLVGATRYAEDAAAETIWRRVGDIQTRRYTRLAQAAS